MIYFIVNPIAGTGRALDKLREIEAQMTGKYRVLMTNAPMDARGLAQLAAAEGAEKIAVVGGDGTMQEAVSGLIGSKIPIGFIPGGSGNDFIKSLGINGKLKTSDYLDIIRHGNAREFDAVKMDSFYFANIGSVGLDSEIVHTATGLKSRFGGGAYVASTMSCIMRHQPIGMYLKIDGREEIHDEFTLVAICNGSIYGGGYKIAPSAKADDGYLTLVLIRKISKPAMFALFPTILAGKHTLLREVEFINCKEVSISYADVQKVNLDGNIYQLKGPLEFKIVEKALNILC